ncbi:hypothetical protein WA171_003217, partial [Blastocystis sp. BT1]
MNSQETTQTEIEDIINSQKERYNEQLKQLYEFVEEYKRLSGIDPITGQKSLSFKSLTDQENHFIEKACKDGSLYPLTVFETRLLECFNPMTGTVCTIDKAKQFVILLQNTLGVGQRYLLLESIKRIRSPEVWSYLYSQDIHLILLRYLSDNCDLISDYDYIYTLISLLNSIPTPQSLNISKTITKDVSRGLFPFSCCGDPDL